MTGRALTVAAALAAAGLVAACLVVFGLSARGLVASYFVAVLVVLSVIDLRERRLPNRIVLPSAAGVLVAQVAREPDRSLEWTLAALGAAVFLFLPLLVFPAGMGMGDVKLALLLGAGLGQGVVAALVIGLFCAFLAGIALIAARGLRARKTFIPFGPFLAFGAIAALFLDGT